MPYSLPSEFDEKLVAPVITHAFRNNDLDLALDEFDDAMNAPMQAAQSKLKEHAKQDLIQTNLFGSPAR